MDRKYNSKFSYCYHIAELDDKQLSKCSSIIHGFVIDKMIEEGASVCKIAKINIAKAIDIFNNRYSEEFGITKDLKGIRQLNESIDDF